MDIFRNLINLQPNRKRVITVGTFDGIHVGHQALLKTVIEKAKNYGAKSTLITFSPHPKLVVPRKDNKSIALLSTIKEKISFLEQIGLDQFIILNFTEQFSKISSENFIEKILIEQIGFQEIVIGHDHAFGKDRAGSFKLLKQLASKHQYRVELVDAIYLDGEIVSSTILRNLITAGAIEKANRFLGRSYTLAGRVIRGDGIGRYLSFPTANVQPLSREKIVPQNGVYAVQVNLNNVSYLGALSIGTRPTFSKTNRTIEVYLINYDGDLYDNCLVIKFLKHLRHEMKFDSANKLMQQIKLDVQQISEQFETQMYRETASQTNELFQSPKIIAETDRFITTK